MLVYAAIGLLVVVVAALATLLALDLGKAEPGSRLVTLKSWQGLMGSVLGFLGAAGVLVLSNAIETNDAQARADRAAHAIGLAMAIEVEKLSTGLIFGREAGATINFDVDNAGNLPQTCLFYSQAVNRALVTATPVYTAALGSMIDFGDENLAVFVRFYAFYLDFLRAIKQVDQAACNDDAEGEIKYILSQVNGGLDFYGVIAGKYDIAPVIKSSDIAPPESDHT